MDIFILSFFFSNWKTYVFIKFVVSKTADIICSCCCFYSCAKLLFVIFVFVYTKPDCTIKADIDTVTVHASVVWHWHRTCVCRFVLPAARWSFETKSFLYKFSVGILFIQLVSSFFSLSNRPLRFCRIDTLLFDINVLGFRFRDVFICMFVTVLCRL